MSLSDEATRLRRNPHFGEVSLKTQEGPWLAGCGAPQARCGFVTPQAVSYPLHQFLDESRLTQFETSPQKVKSQKAPRCRSGKVTRYSPSTGEAQIITNTRWFVEGRCRLSGDVCSALALQPFSMCLVWRYARRIFHPPQQEATAARPSQPNCFGGVGSAKEAETVGLCSV